MGDRRDVTVRYDTGDRFGILIGQHVVVVDQPSDNGGGDTGPTPTELFVASLASCVAFFAQRFLHRNGVDTSGLEVSAAYTWAEKPHRVGAIDVRVAVPPISEALVQPLQRVIEHCTVHNSLHTPPEITITVREQT